MRSSTTKLPLPPKRRIEDCQRLLAHDARVLDALVDSRRDAVLRVFPAGPLVLSAKESGIEFDPGYAALPHQLCSIAHRLFVIPYFLVF
jgi:hypothetical protein